MPSVKHEYHSGGGGVDMSERREETPDEMQMNREIKRSDETGDLRMEGEISRSILRVVCEAQNACCYWRGNPYVHNTTAHCEVVHA